MIINLYFLIPAMIAQIFIATADIPIPTGTLTKEANAEIETQLLTTETKARKRLKSRITLSLVIFFFKVLIYYIVNFLIVIRKNIFFESDTLKSIHDRIIILKSRYVVDDGFIFDFA